MLEDAAMKKLEGSLVEVAESPPVECDWVTMHLISLITSEGDPLLNRAGVVEEEEPSAVHLL